jgi:hypothetical protein
MTRSDAIAKATRRAQRGGAHLVTARTAHPRYPGRTVYLTVAKSDKRTWAEDERLVWHTDHPDDITGAWYALDCAPPYRMQDLSDARGNARQGASCAGLGMTAQDLRKAEARYQRASARSEQAREDRNLAVRQALADGMTHAQIADATGLSRGRIGQIAQIREET